MVCRSRPKVRSRRSGKCAMQTAIDPLSRLDTSLLVAALTNESESARIQNWFARQTAGSLAISE